MDTAGVGLSLAGGGGGGRVDPAGDHFGSAAHKPFYPCVVVSSATVNVFSSLPVLKSLEMQPGSHMLLT